MILTPRWAFFLDLAKPENLDTLHSRQLRGLLSSAAAVGLAAENNHWLLTHFNKLLDSELARAGKLYVSVNAAAAGYDGEVIDSVGRRFRFPVRAAPHAGIVRLVGRPGPSQVGNGIFGMDAASLAARGENPLPPAPGDYRMMTCPHRQKRISDRAVPSAAANALYAWKWIPGEQGITGAAGFGFLNSPLLQPVCLKQVFLYKLLAALILALGANVKFTCSISALQASRFLPL